jgi:hypothetical protein
LIVSNIDHPCCIPLALKSHFCSVVTLSMLLMCARNRERDTQLSVPDVVTCVICLLCLSTIYHKACKVMTLILTRMGHNVGHPSTMTTAAAKIISSALACRRYPSRIWDGCAMLWGNSWHRRHCSCNGKNEEGKRIMAQQGTEAGRTATKTQIVAAGCRRVTGSCHPCRLSGLWATPALMATLAPCHCCGRNLECRHPVRTVS